MLGKRGRDVGADKVGDALKIALEDK